MFQGIKEHDTLNDSIVALRDHHTTRVEDDHLYSSSTIAFKGGKNICYWELMPSSAGFRRNPAESGGMCTIVQVFSEKGTRARGSVLAGCDLPNAMASSDTYFPALSDSRSYLHLK